MENVKRKQEKIAIFGAGFIGNALAAYCRKRGEEVVLFSRERKAGHAYWNPAKGEIDWKELEGVTVVINFSGESLFGRWSKRKKERIWKSRVESSRFLVSQLLRLTEKPKVYFSASAVGYYGNQTVQPVTEKEGVGRGFLAELCEAWEKTTLPLRHEMRVICCRFGVVLSKNGGTLPKMILPFKWGVGSRLGSGKEHLSWISLDDCLAAIFYLIQQQRLAGAINFTSPFPITNREITNILSRHYHKAWFSLPKWLFTLFLGQGSDFIFSDLQVVPERLLQSGFQFKFPHFDDLIN